MSAIHALLAAIDRRITDITDIRADPAASLLASIGGVSRRPRRESLLTYIVVTDLTVFSTRAKRHLLADAMLLDRAADAVPAGTAQVQALPGAGRGLRPGYGRIYCSTRRGGA